MKVLLIPILNILLITSCQSQSPEEILNVIKNKFFDSQSVSFDVEAYLPNPGGTVDTTEIQMNFVKNKNSITGYDAMIDDEYFDHFYIDGEYKYVNHFKKTVELFTDQKPEYRKAILESSSSYKRSPMVLLRDFKWEFVKDTIINDQEIMDYYRIENDKVVDGNTIYTEQHLFINPESNLLERWERRNYFKGSLSTEIAYTFKNYEFNTVKEKLTFNTPSSYVSKLFSQKEELLPLQKGEIAPNFEKKDMNENLWDLKAFKGKKVLLKFSSIGCPHSHDALSYMNQDDFELPDNIKPMYLSIFDKEAKVKNYFSEIKAGMPVLLNSEDIAKMYKVTSTPTFILVDENGVIEKVVIGNDKVFLDSLE